VADAGTTASEHFSDRERHARDPAPRRAMILTDASVVIVSERAPTPRLKKIIADSAAAVCGLTVAELYAGVRTTKDEAKLRSALADFQSQAIPDSLWEAVGPTQSTLLKRGHSPVDRHSPGDACHRARR